MTPMAKAKAIRDLREAGRKSLFVGDGLNDAPAMAEAHVSVAVESGSALAADTADIRFAVVSETTGRRCLAIVPTLAMEDSFSQL